LEGPRDGTSRPACPACEEGAIASIAKTVVTMKSGTMAPTTDTSAASFDLSKAIAVYDDVYG